MLYIRQHFNTPMAVVRSKGLDNDREADQVLRDAGIMQREMWTFPIHYLSQAVAVLRFHGFEVEVEE